MQTAPWRAALAIRWTVLKRRHGSPLEAVVLLVGCGLAWLLGKALAPRLADDPALLPLLAALAPLAVLALVTTTAASLLYSSRELVLLLGHGLSPRDLVRLRLVELIALAGLALTPLFVGLVGTRVASGAQPAPLLLVSLPLCAVHLASSGLLLAWLTGNRNGAKRLLLAVGVALAAALIALRPAAVGENLLASLEGRGPGRIVELAFEAAIVLGLALWLAPRGHGAALDRGVGRTRRAAPRSWKLLGLASAPLGGQTAALVRRDLALLLRGGFLRGAAILLLLPLALGIVVVVRRDPSIERWQLVLVGLLLTGVLSSASGFLFGVDFPRHRRAQLLLERTQPLRGRAVLVSRWVPAATYALLIVAAVAALIATAEPRLAKGAGGFAIRGLLLALVVTHHAVTYGMRSEGQLDPAEAAAYPMNGAAVVILFALGILFHPAVALAYPLLWFGFARQAVQRWETAEVETEHQAAA